METLADFGVSSYFGIQTFTAGIYKAWLSMDNRMAAAQLATCCWCLVAVLLASGAPAPDKRMRFCRQPGRPRRVSAEARPVRLSRPGRTALAGLCAVPVLLGFVLPVLFMLRPAAAGWAVLPWDRFCAAGR